MLVITVNILICLLLAKKFSVRNCPVGGNPRRLCIACGWRCRPTQTEVQLPKGGRLFPHPESWGGFQGTGTAFRKGFLLPLSAPALPPFTCGFNGS